MSISKLYSDHFTYEELQCPLSKEIECQPGFIFELEKLRKEYAKPMLVTSCCRSEARNKMIGGHPKSLHMMENPFYQVGGKPLQTCAIDIQRPDGVSLYRLIAIAVQNSWTVGVSDTFIHLDMRSRFLEMPPRIYTY